MKTRRNDGQGSLRLRGQAWWLRISVGGDVKDVPLGVYGGETNRKEAERSAKKVAKQMRETHTGLKVLAHMGVTPAAPKGDTPTFLQWWERYQNIYLPDKTTRTQQRNRQIVEHWAPLLGHLPLDEIKQADCKEFLMRRRHAYTAHVTRKVRTRLTEDTVQHERRLIQAIFQRAVENDIILKNPWLGIPGSVGKSRSDRILTEEDEVKLLAAMRTPVQVAGRVMERMDERYPRFVLFLLQTGLRIDELLNTHFRDEGDYVHVKGKFAKERDVALTSAARKLLDEQWADQGSWRFPRPEGSRPWWQVEPRFRGVMKVACKRAGIRHLSPHDLRHTFGHRYLVKGGTLQDLSRILGHASTAVTEKHYGYLRKEDVRDKMLAVMEPVV